MKTKHRYLKAFFLTIVIVSVSLFNSCDYSYLDIFDEDIDYTYEPTFAFPVVKADLTINDIFDLEEVSSIVVEDDRLIKLVYKGRVYSVEAKDLFYFDELESFFTYHYTPPSKSTLSAETFQFYFDLDGQSRIDELKFASGQLEIDVSADELVQDGYDLKFEMSVAGSDDGSENEFSVEFLLQDTPVDFDLAGYTFEFGEDEAGNYLNIDYTISVETYGTPINAPYEIGFTKTIKNDHGDYVEYEYITGYIDNFDFSVGSDTIDLGVYKESIISNVFFKEPYMEIFAENSMGFPLDIHFDKFCFYNDDGDTLDVGGHGFENNNPWRVNYPSISMMGQSVITDEMLDRDNTNIDDLLAINPLEVKYRVRGEANPDQDTGITNFIEHNSQFNVDVEINLPLYGNLQKYKFQDTLDFPLPEEDAENIDWLELKFVMDNGFPVDLSLQAYALDGENNLITALFDDYEKILESGKVDVEGKVTEKTRKETIIFIDRDKFEEISDAEYLVVSFGIMTKQESNSSKSSGDPFSVKIYDHYTIGVQMGVRVKLAVKW